MRIMHDYLHAVEHVDECVKLLSTVQFELSKQPGIDTLSIKINSIILAATTLAEEMRIEQ